MVVSAKAATSMLHPSPAEARSSEVIKKSSSLCMARMSSGIERKIFAEIFFLLLVCACGNFVYRFEMITERRRARRTTELCMKTFLQQ
jgi:hypothetical protein